MKLLVKDIIILIINQLLRVSWQWNSQIVQSKIANYPEWKSRIKYIIVNRPWCEFVKWWIVRTSFIYITLNMRAEVESRVNSHTEILHFIHTCQCVQCIHFALWWQLMPKVSILHLSGWKLRSQFTDHRCIKHSSSY